MHRILLLTGLLALPACDQLQALVGKDAPSTAPPAPPPLAEAPPTDKEEPSEGIPTQGVHYAEIGGPPQDTGGSGGAAQDDALEEVGRALSIRPPGAQLIRVPSPKIMPPTKAIHTKLTMRKKASELPRARWVEAARKKLLGAAKGQGYDAIRDVQVGDLACGSTECWLTARATAHKRRQ